MNRLDYGTGCWAMQGSLGEKIGEGFNSDVHAWAPGQIVKLFKAGASPQFVRHEARMTRAAFAASAPQVFDEVTLDGRFGIVMEQLDGPTLQEQLQTRVVTPAQAGAILAKLYMAVHHTAPLPSVVPLRVWIEAASRTSRDILPEHLAAGVIALIDRLPPADELCHADLHPGNVIMTADGPRIIDWACALRAPGIVDVGRAHVTISELLPEGDNPELRRGISDALQSEYARLAGLSLAVLTAAMEPYLPVVRALVLLQQRPATPAQRERMIQRIAAALLSED